MASHLEMQSNFSRSDKNCAVDPMVMAKLYAIRETVEDRVEMHNQLKEQRNNWNSLLFTSINSITLSAATITGIASIGSKFSPLPFVSTGLYLFATGLLLIVSKLQPSQLVEEQRNATRQFRNLRSQVKTIMSLGNGTDDDVREISEKVLALDKAFPLPLKTMLDKFPITVEAAVWWPKVGKNIGGKRIWGKGTERERNGWSGELEEEMRGLIGVLEKKDREWFLKVPRACLKMNKFLANSGPLLTVLAAIGSAFLGYDSNSTWAAAVGVGAGAMAGVVNMFSHGAQIGMVFELYRNLLGYNKLIEETIGANLEEREVERRENGELLEFKLALQLGRNLSELKSLGASSYQNGAQSIEEFANKIFN